MSARPLQLHLHHDLHLFSTLLTSLDCCREYLTAFGEFVAEEDADDFDDLDERAGGGDCGCRPGEVRTRSLIKLNVYFIFLTLLRMHRY